MGPGWNGSARTRGRREQPGRSETLPVASGASGGPRRPTMDPPIIALCTPPPNIDVMLKLGVGSAQAQFMDRLLPEARLVEWGGACSHMCLCLSRCARAGAVR